jgi:hypothetical protein
MSRLIETGADVVSSMLKIWLGILIFVLVVLAVGLYALFHGYFDHGLFEIKQVEWSASTPRRVAVVAERSDHEAMSSNVYFVLIGNHIFSPAELRRAYYSDAVVFAAASNCLTVSWNGPHHLVLDCRGGKIDAAHIDARKSIADDVAITYVNIADGTAKEFQPTP